MQMIFIASSVFQKVKNHFPACGEKCLKQDASMYYPVMVIVRKADFYNKYKARISELNELGNRAFICFRRYAPYDHDLFSFWASCKFFSEHAERKVIWSSEKQEGITNLHGHMEFLRCICSDNFAQHISNPLRQYNFDESSKKTASARALRCGKFLYL